LDPLFLALALARLPLFLHQILPGCAGITLQRRLEIFDLRDTTPPIPVRIRDFIDFLYAVFPLDSFLAALRATCDLDSTPFALSPPPLSLSTFFQIYRRLDNNKKEEARENSESRVAKKVEALDNGYGI
jgi:hypothetical protein